MPALMLYLFGGVTLQVGASKPLSFPTKKSKSLLAFLVLSKERTFPRSVLAGQFWPESEAERAQRSLNSEVWRLRAMFKSAGLQPSDILVSNSEIIGFRSDCNHWVDAGEFYAATRTLHTSGVADCDLASHLTSAVRLYRGDLVEGLFDEWCLVLREAYRARLISALEFLLEEAMQSHQWKSGVSHGRRILELDPLQEHVHRALMRCYLGMGNRPAALRQYEIIRQVLHDELQIEPMDETTELYRKIAAKMRSTDDPQFPRTALASMAEKLDAVQRDLLRAKLALEDVGQYFHGARGLDGVVAE
jgi:DNA-binding SARP family transcriptional activator